MRSIAEIFRSYGVLDGAGRHFNGTDKETCHHYGDAYEALFPDRAAARLMMEVGIADGSSLLGWREVFPNAVCVGLDVHPPACLHGDRTEFHLGDQRSRDDCDRAADGRLFDVIVEDATHELANTLLTLLYLWPHVAPGGIYVVEEFADVGSLRGHITALWPNATVVDTVNQFGGVEPLVVLRRPL